MIINVEDVFYDKPTFSSAVYFGLSLLLFFGFAYRLGAGEHAGPLSLFFLVVIIALLVGYPASVYWRFIVRRKVAIQLYKQHLYQLDEAQMLTLVSHKQLSAFSKPIVEQVGYDRFGRNHQQPKSGTHDG